MTRQAILNEFWKDWTREEVLKRDKRCVLCFKRDTLHIHRILGRNGAGGLIAIHKKLSITVCAWCHANEKSGNAKKSKEFLERTFLKAGGVISRSLEAEGNWSIEFVANGERYNLVALSGHNSVKYNLYRRTISDFGYKEDWILLGRDDPRRITDKYMKEAKINEI